MKFEKRGTVIKPHRIHCELDLTSNVNESYLELAPFYVQMQTDTIPIVHSHWNRLDLPRKSLAFLVASDKRCYSYQQHTFYFLAIRFLPGIP